MKTLIELYDESPIENVLSADTFLPACTVYLCPSEIAQNKEKQKSMRDYFASRGLDMDIVFLDTSLYHTDKVEKQLRSVIEKYPDCAIDIAGGSDAALFAAGMVCKDTDVAVFTHSRKKQRFFNINNADFADHLDITLQYSIEDFFRMASGDMKSGRVDNDLLSDYLNVIDGFFNLYMKYRKQWKTIVSWFQRASAADQNGRASLHVQSDYTVKGERASRIPANEEALRALEKLGFLLNLEIVPGRSVKFRFRDEQIRYWLRDQGSVLEIYAWKACLDAAIFHEVRCSTIVEWERGNGSGDRISNEIDVMAVRNATPVFISCKTCPVDTDAINELAILRDRFGGDAAKAVIISTENCRAITRRRAEAMNINIITLNDIRSCKLSDQIRSLSE